MIDWPAECPGGCGASVKYGLSRHGKALRTCKCPDAIGRRNRKRGKTAQRNVHQALGGKGWAPSNEEWSGAYSIEVRIEAKAGEQIPATFRRFVSLEWTRRALSQAERATPAGEQSFPSVYMELPGGGKWLVVKL